MNPLQEHNQNKEQAMLRMSNLSKVYRTHMIETHALRGFEIHVSQGEFVTVDRKSVV